MPLDYLAIVQQFADGRPSAEALEQLQRAANNVVYGERLRGDPPRGLDEELGRLGTTLQCRMDRRNQIVRESFAAYFAEHRFKYAWKCPRDAFDAFVSEVVAFKKRKFQAWKKLHNGPPKDADEFEVLLYNACKILAPPTSKKQLERILSDMLSEACPESSETIALNHNDRGESDDGCIV